MRSASRRPHRGPGLRRGPEAAFWPETGRSGVRAGPAVGLAVQPQPSRRALGERVPRRGWARTGTPLDCYARSQACT